MELSADTEQMTTEIIKNLADDLINSTESFNSTDSFNSTESSLRKWVPLDTFIGLVLAILSCLFIGVSVIYKKLALKDIEEKGGTRAVDGGYGYLRMPKWWFGIIMMAIGEFSNFIAYIFAPAILVTPLGVFSIVCTAALSPYFLKERLKTIGKLGCALVLVGCVIVTLCGPKDREVRTLEELENQLVHPGFLIYASIVVVISSFLMCLVPRYGHKYVMFYITICSSFGSLSVMFCKGVGLVLKQTIAGNNGFTHWAAWVCLVSLIVSLLIETVYMQKALDLFSSSVFMSVNYVMFTSMVIIASSILYTELRELGAKNIILTILGFVVNIVALYLLHVDKGDASLPVAKNPTETEGENQESFIVKNIKNFVGEIENARASPLSHIGLNSSILIEGKNKFLQFIDSDVPHNQLDSGNEDNSRPETPKICLDDSKSRSVNSLYEDTVQIPKFIRTDETKNSSCEVPLITQMQEDSKVPSAKNVEKFDKKENFKNICTKVRLPREALAKINENTRLV